MAVDIINPYTGQKLASLPLTTREEVESALAGAQAAFEAHRHTRAEVRAGWLERVAEEIDADATGLAELIVAETGKPITPAKAEVARAASTFRFAAQEAVRMGSGDEVAIDASPAGKGHHGEVKRFPLGIIYGITPFNFPLNLVAHKVAPALASGNAIIIKPTPKSPLTAFRLGEILQRAGVPRGLVTFLLLGNPQAAALLEDDRIAMLSFTGSDTVGWELAKRAGRKRVTLELGGNAAVIVHRDADWAAAVPEIAQGAFSNSGQSCISVQRIFVHEEIAKPFTEALVKYTREEIVICDPMDPKTVMGAMIDSDAVTRVLAWIAEAQAAGAWVLTGAKAHEKTILPTLLTDVAPGMKVLDREVFGPLATVLTYSSEEEAIRLVNASVYGLQAGVYTHDAAFAAKAFAEIEAGAVLINQVPTFRVENMPYGGIKESGRGREGLRYAMEDMTEMRLLITRHLTSGKA